MPSKVSRNINNYLKCTSLLDEFFDKLGFCKKCPGDKDYGCCKSNVFGFYKGVDKHVKKKFKKLVFSKFHKQNKSKACYFIRKEKGCVLKEYKTPFCFSFICSDLKNYLFENYQINYSFNNIIQKLRAVLNGEITRKEYNKFIKELEKITCLV
jgi:hypothetical protein